MRCDELERFMAKIEAMPWDCWWWTGARNNKGYGSTWVGKKPLTAHVVAYETFVGHVPPGYEVDHLCRFRCCVNPYHLEAVTPKINSSRRAARRLSPTCRRGHPKTDAGYCVTCKREADARRWKRQHP